MAMPSGLPTSAADLKLALDTIENQINLYLLNPAAFFESIGGSVKVSIPQYIEALQRRRDQLFAAYCAHPEGWVDSDVDANGPMIKTN